MSVINYVIRISPKYITKHTNEPLIYKAVCYDKTEFKFEVSSQEYSRVARSEDSIGMFVTAKAKTFEHTLR